MDELTRFARQLAKRLATRPGGKDGPVSVADIRKTLLPYGAQRRALGLSSVEDYETTLLRLIAGERGYARSDPPDAAERCREELGRVTPDLELLDQLGGSLIELTTLVGSEEVPAPAAPPEPKPAAAPRQPVPEPAPMTERAAGLACPKCQEALPSGRIVTFCPWCGERLIPLRCNRCRTELESGWRHCITCGAPVEDPYRSA